MPFFPVSQMEEKSKMESEIHLLQMLVTDSFSDLLSDDINKTRVLASCPVLPAMPRLWKNEVKCDPRPCLGAWQVEFAPVPASADALRLLNISGTTCSHEHLQQNSPIREVAGQQVIIHSMIPPNCAQHNVSGKIHRAQIHLTPELTIQKDLALATEGKCFPTLYIVYSVKIITR